MKQKDKQNISQLEKKLKAEQEARSFVEKQLMEEKKRKKLEEATAARAVAFAAASRYVHAALSPCPAPPSLPQCFIWGGPALHQDKDQHGSLRPRAGLK